VLTKAQAHTLAELLQMLMSAIETGNESLAKDYVHKITDFMHDHTDPASR